MQSLVLAKEGDMEHLMLYVWPITEANAKLSHKVHSNEQHGISILVPHEIKDIM